MEKLIIFDCDGTLVDSEVIASNVFPKYWATHGVHFTETEFKEKFIGTGRTAPIVIENYSKMPSHAREEGERLFDEELAKELRAVCGIEELVSSLKFDLCVASNSSLNYVKEALIKTNLSSYFKGNVFSSEQVENPKPAPDLLLYLSSKLKYQVEDCIVIEDSVSGVRAAQNAKMKVIGFSGAAHFVPSLKNQLIETHPDWFCSTTKELSELLNDLYEM
jgi:HAD superfamily hydrolase (TIGR01509 family)